MFVGGRSGGGRFDVVGQPGPGWLAALAWWLLQLRLLLSLRVHDFVLQPLRDGLRLVVRQPLLVSVLLESVLLLLEPVQFLLEPVQLLLEPLLPFLLRRGVQLL